MITEAFESLVEKIRMGELKAVENEHTVVLGWSEGTVRLVCQLAFLRRQWQMMNEGWRRYLFCRRRPPPSTSYVDDGDDHMELRSACTSARTYSWADSVDGYIARFMDAVEPDLLPSWSRIGTPMGAAALATQLSAPSSPQAGAAGLSLPPMPRGLRDPEEACSVTSEVPSVLREEANEYVAFLLEGFPSSDACECFTAATEDLVDAVDSPWPSPPRLLPPGT